ncbi:hypothetical protein AM501_24605 [Aneurinibacillus migulanus]|uniref:DUF2062 domain-containing protein n=1 Tax=Aneurinibacillus migulanus TaxID=47500 RepID=A0A0D1XYG6_ANEMI|nr:DUF2062 domain-containing protein [Aneurinibacillus migulanus]KIV52072.1 hypothetical protein TS65_26560 [Aneurinibacillus migulanus]KIV54237.1 hypothetical protein TS64_14090 [Aneurinibacillus migulanus]KON98209.1 hypothetical protein AF333_25040 [Aneurinibacillus migulanus]KPD05799.1 hypothetical protein AM501_24605 [Aneurinibacillus migulanus]MED0891511.1 DUF2062 domain-containing protein [Aneurinibacillus migulanus]
MWRKLYRKVKYQYVKLLRSKGAPSIVARSFALGIFIEFITLPTLGSAFLLLYPLNLLIRGSFAASLIGFVMGKFVLPIFFVPNLSVGNMLVGSKFGAAAHGHMGHMGLVALWEFVKEKGVAFLVGSATNGTIVAIICYALVFYALQLYRKKRENRRLALQLEKNTH